MAIVLFTSINRHRDNPNRIFSGTYQLPNALYLGRDMVLLRVLSSGIGHFVFWASSSWTVVVHWRRRGFLSDMGTTFQILQKKHLNFTYIGYYYQADFKNFMPALHTKWIIQLHRQHFPIWSNGYWWAWSLFYLHQRKFDHSTQDIYHPIPTANHFHPVNFLSISFQYRLYALERNFQNTNSIIHHLGYFVYVFDYLRVSHWPKHHQHRK